MVSVSGDDDAPVDLPIDPDLVVGEGEGEVLQLPLGDAVGAVQRGQVVPVNAGLQHNNPNIIIPKFTAPELPGRSYYEYYEAGNCCPALVTLLLGFMAA